MKKYLIVAFLLVALAALGLVLGCGSTSSSSTTTTTAGGTTTSTSTGTTTTTSAGGTHTSFQGATLGQAKTTVDAALGTATYQGTYGNLVSYRYGTDIYISYISDVVVQIETDNSSTSLDGVSVGDDYLTQVVLAKGSLAPKSNLVWYTYYWADNFYVCLNSASGTVITVGIADYSRFDQMY